MPDTLVPYHEGMEYGIGLDSPSGDTRNVGVIGTPTAIPNAGGSIVDFELRVCLETKPLQEKTLSPMRGKAKNGLTG